MPEAKSQYTALKSPGIVGSFDDAKAIRDYARRTAHPDQTPAVIESLYGDQRIGYENRSVTHQIDPELDELLGSTGYDMPINPQVRKELTLAQKTEEAYFKSRTRFDWDYAMANYEDMELFAANPDAMGWISDVAAFERIYTGAEQAAAASRNAVLDWFADVYEIGPERAAIELQRLGVIEETAREAVALMSDEDLARKYGGDLGGGLSEMADEMRGERPEAQLAQWREMALQDEMSWRTREAFPDTPSGLDFWDAWNENPSGITERVYAAFEWVGPLFQKGIEGAGWIFSNTPGGELAINAWSGAMQQTSYYENSETVQARQEHRAALEMELGRPNTELVAQFAAMPLEQSWAQLQTANPLEYQRYLAMGGGNVTIAKSFWSADNLDTEFVLDRDYMGFAAGTTVSTKDLAEAGAKEYEDGVAFQLRQLEDANFGAGEAFMDIISIWGEMTEDIATSVSVGAKNLWQAETWGELWGFMSSGADMEAWQSEMQAAGSPSEVFGLDGTLVGLGLDFGLMAAVDPTTYVFGPSLSASGRAGAVSAQTARRLVDSQVATLGRQQIVSGIRSSSRGPLFAASIMDAMNTTGLGSRYLAALQGFDNPLLGRWTQMKTWGAVADDIHIRNFDDLVPAGEVDDAALAALESGDYKPVVIAVNPETGVQRVVSGEAYVIAARSKGYDNLKVTLQPDTSLGTVVDPRWQNVIDNVDDFEVGDALDTAAQADITAKYESRQAAGTLGPQVASTPSGYKVHWAQDQTNFISVLDESGDFVGGLEWSQGSFAGKPEGSFSTGAVVRPGQGIGTELLPVLAELLPEDVVIAMMTDNSFSGAATGLVKKYAASRLVPDANAPTADWVTRQGLDRAQDVNGTSYIAPRHMMPDDLRWGDTPNMEYLKSLEYDHILAGGKPLNGQRLAVSVGIGHSIRESLTRFGVTRRMQQFMTPLNNSTILKFTGPRSQAQVNHMFARLFGAVEDMDNYMLVQRRVDDFWYGRGQMQVRADDMTIQLRGLEAELQGLRTTTLNYIPEAGTSVVDAQLALRKQIRAAEDRIVSLRDEQNALYKQMTDYSDLNKILQESLDEYNRTHIASRKEWAEFVDPETGMVPWEHITDRSSRSGEYLETVLRKASEEKISALDAARELGTPSNAVESLLATLDDAADNQLGQFLLDMHGAQRALTAFELPASPLELMTAANASKRVVQELAVDTRRVAMREGLHTAHTAWMIDKVLTPRTGIVVSLDELMRAWQKGGIRAVGAWMEDRVMFAANRVHAIRTSPDAGRLSSRWQRRMQALEEIPDFFRDLERSILELHGYGLDTIKFKKGAIADNADYYAAAQQQSMSLVRSPGFRAYLQGEDAFREWFTTNTEAGWLRDMDYYAAADFRRSALAQWEDVYQGYNQVMELALDGIKPGKRGQAQKIWREAAERSAEAQHAGALPQWVLEGWQEVSGAAKLPRGFIPRSVDYISDHLFQRPMNYRQGFVAELVRKSEKARLVKLYETQGIRVVSDMELLEFLRTKYPSLHDDVLRDGLDLTANQLRERFKVVTQRQVDDIIESAVEEEMENMLYAFHRQSQMGRHSRGLFPFGRPWADMWGHWGREMMARPQLRGWLNETNFLNIGEIANGVVDALPFNPRTGAFISRVAATDFGMENIEDDPIFGGAAEALGVESLDVGGAMFLPSKGQQPFLLMLPGLGLVPSQFAEAIIARNAPDAFEDPQAFALYMEQWEQFLPGVSYNRPTSIASGVYDALVGGGATSRLMGLGASMGMAMGLSSSATKDTITSDWKTAVAHDRQIRVLMADPEIWGELMELTPATAGIGLQALVNETLQDMQDQAAQPVGVQRTIEGVIEMSIPSNVDSLSQPEDLHDVWIDSIDAMGLSETFVKRLDLVTPQGRREAASRIADHYWNMPVGERDQLIAANPQMAVNIVSVWSWTDLASERGVEDSGFPYRSGGSTEDRARHAALIQQGFIRPLTPRELMVNIIGTVYSAQANVAARVYTDTARLVNDARYEDAGVEQYMQSLLDELGDSVPYTTPRAAWDNFGDVREALWEKQGRPMKAIKRDGVWVEVPDMVNLPDEESRWGEGLPYEFTGLRQEYETGNFEIPELTDEIMAAAEAVGLEVFQGMQMRDLWQEVADHRANLLTDNPVYQQISPEYSTWLAPRGQEAQQVVSDLNRVIDHSNINNDARYQYQRTLMYIEEAITRKRMGDDSWIDVRNDAARMFQEFADDPVLGKRDLNSDWDKAWGRSLGALDWEPLEPPPLRVDGNVVSEAIQVIPQEVYDGDTVQFATDPTRRMFGDIGPRLPQDVYSVRLLGVNAAEMGEEGGNTDRALLADAVEEAIANGTPIYLVRDPSRFGSTDFYGRMFAWLYIGDEPFHRPETQLPRR